MIKKGLYIVFEGPDGSGKSIQAKKVIQVLNEKGLNTIHFREPGGEIGKQDTVGEKIRAILQDKENTINAKCELALFTANRAQLIEEIRAYTDKGLNVVCERSFLSSIVYQGFGREIDIDTIIDVTRIFVNKLPDLAFIYNVGTQNSIERIIKRGERDRIENESVAFHNRISEGYKNLKPICDKLQIPCIEIDTEEMHWDEYVETVLNRILEYRNK